MASRSQLFRSADRRTARTADRLHISGVDPELQYSVEPGTRLAWEISLGRETPIFARAKMDDSTRALKGSQGNTDYRFSLAKLKYYRVVSVATGAIDDKLEGTGGAATRPSRATSKTQRGRKRSTRRRGGKQ